MNDAVVLVQIDQVKRRESARNGHSPEVCQPQPGFAIGPQALHQDLENLQRLKRRINNDQARAEESLAFAVVRIDDLRVHNSSFTKKTLFTTL